MNQQQIMRQVQQMQAAMAQAQDEIAADGGVRLGGGGMVTATVTGSGDLEEHQDRSAAVDPEDVEMLEDLVVAAVTEARRPPTRCRRRRWAPSPAASGLAAGRQWA